MASKHSVAKTATEGLKILWGNKFFLAWKKIDAVVVALAKFGNHFSNAELGMALMRARHLTRRGKRGSYEYIQKYPYAHEDNVPATPKRNKRRKHA